MNKKRLVPIIVLILGLSIAAYAVYAVKAGKTKVSTNNAANVNNDFNSKSEAEKAKLLKEREELEKQRKEQMGEFYVPLPPLGEASKITTVKAKAIYLTGTVAGFAFNEDNIKYYADYIRSISGQSGKPADTSRLAQINKLEKALAICESTEVNALVIDIKDDDGFVNWNSDIGIVNQIKSNSSAPFKNYGK